MWWPTVMVRWRSAARRAICSSKAALQSRNDVDVRDGAPRALARGNPEERGHDGEICGSIRPRSDLVEVVRLGRDLLQTLKMISAPCDDFVLLDTFAIRGLDVEAELAPAAVEVVCAQPPGCDPRQSEGVNVRFSNERFQRLLLVG